MKPSPHCGEIRKLTDQPHLNLFSVEVKGGSRTRHWTFASRKPRPQTSRSDGDAVVIVAVVPGEDEPRLLIIREFRPALGGHELALPAGLIDADEDAAAAARRELWEETGMRLTRTTHISPPVASSSGLTDETIVFVYGEAEGTLSAEHQEDNESIDARLVTLGELRALLNGEADDTISSRLYTTALGFLQSGRLSPPRLGPPAADGGVTTLFRPVGPEELALIRATDFTAFPPRLPEQAIFYPVLDESYAKQIAREWNVPASGVGYVTRFQVPSAFLDRYECRIVGDRTHAELWVPAEELAAFNAMILGPIQIVAEFHPST